jgi:hypothetical protein
MDASRRLWGQRLSQTFNLPNAEKSPFNAMNPLKGLFLPVGRGNEEGWPYIMTP